MIVSDVYSFIIIQNVQILENVLLEPFGSQSMVSFNLPFTFLYNSVYNSCLLQYAQLFPVQNSIISAVHLAFSCLEYIYSCSTLSCFLYRIVLFLQYIQLFHVQTIFIPALHLAVSCTKYIYCCSTFSCFLHRISKRTIMISSFSLIRFKDFFVRGLEKWNAIYIYVHVHSTLHTENSRSYRFKVIPHKF